MEGGKEGGKEQGGVSKKGGRGETITFPELMWYMRSVLGTNERFIPDPPTPERLSSFNTVYTQWVKWMKEQDKWRDQHGKPVTDITKNSEESIDLRVQEVYTKTNKDGKIPSDKQVSDIQEELREAYFNFLTSDNPPEPVSSEDEDTKAGRLDMLVNSHTNKFHKFHPMDLYIYFHFGTVCVGV
jgi:hypothetical protein